MRATQVAVEGLARSRQVRHWLSRFVSDREYRWTAILLAALDGDEETIDWLLGPDALLEFEGKLTKEEQKLKELGLWNTKTSLTTPST